MSSEKSGSVIDRHPLIRLIAGVGIGMLFGPLLVHSSIGRFGVDTRQLLIGLAGCYLWIAAIAELLGFEWPVVLAEVIGLV